MTTLRALLSVVLIAVTVACSGGGAAASATPPAGSATTITAKSSTFDPSTVTVRAGKPVKVFFKNLDGDPHNVAIYSDASATTKVFGGDVITDAATLYEVPAMAAGSYVFRCDVHPNMKGTVIVSG